MVIDHLLDVPVLWNETLLRIFPAGRFCWKFDSRFSLAQNCYPLNFRVIGRLLQLQLAAEKSLILTSCGTTLRTVVRTYQYSCYVRTVYFSLLLPLTDQKPFLLQNIRNRQFDWPENCSATALHYFSLAQQISGQSDRWFLIFCNSKVTGSVSFQSTSTYYVAYHSALLTNETNDDDDV